MKRSWLDSDQGSSTFTSSSLPPDQPKKNEANRRYSFGKQREVKGESDWMESFKQLRIFDSTESKSLAKKPIVDNDRGKNKLDHLEDSRLGFSRFEEEVGISLCVDQLWQQQEQRPVLQSSKKKVSLDIYTDQFADYWKGSSSSTSSLQPDHLIKNETNQKAHETRQLHIFDSTETQLSAKKLIVDYDIGKKKLYETKGTLSSCIGLRGQQQEQEWSQTLKNEKEVINQFADYRKAMLFGVCIGHGKPAQFGDSEEKGLTVGCGEPSEPNLSILSGVSSEISSKDRKRKEIQEGKQKEENGKKRQKQSAQPSQENTNHHNLFPVRKVLTQSDINFLSRLSFGKNVVAENILTSLNLAQMRYVHRLEGIPVIVEDLDTMSPHSLVFKYTRSMHEYVFVSNWTKDFVERRNLQIGDEIGMALVDPERYLFVFTVFKRAKSLQTRLDSV